MCPVIQYIFLSTHFSSFSFSVLSWMTLPTIFLGGEGDILCQYSAKWERFPFHPLCKCLKSPVFCGHYLWRVTKLSTLVIKMGVLVSLKVSWFWNVFLVSSLSSKKRTKTNRQVVCSFFRRNVGLKKPFQICLTFSGRP